jgi:hypothetical protein
METLGSLLCELGWASFDLLLFFIIIAWLSFEKPKLLATIATRPLCSVVGQLNNGGSGGAWWRGGRCRVRGEELSEEDTVVAISDRRKRFR